MASGTFFQNDAASEETTNKRPRLTQSPTLTLTPPSSIPSSSSLHHHALHAPPPPPPLPLLSFDLIVEILSRLPVKFLLQLKCVCKSWNSLLSDSQFAKKHLRASSIDPTQHHLILSYMNPSREFLLRSYSLQHVFNTLCVTPTQLNYPLNNRNRFDLMVGSCHGMICFALNQSYALLWNPTIRKFKKLPSLQNQRREGSYTIFGFGYDHFSDSYKVVAVFCYPSDGGGYISYKNEVKVHTLGTGSWRRIQEFPSGVPFDESGKFVSGTLNWLASPASSSSWVIVSLDLGKESYQEILLPDYGGVAVVTLTLGVLRNCLCVLSHGDTFSDVWLMKEYGNKESWTKLFRVPYMGDADPCPYTKALYVSEDDEILLEFQSKLVVYNSRNGTFKIPEFQNVNGWIVADVNFESLISPCS